MSLEIRTARESDLAAVLALYAQPGMNDALILDLEAARAIFRRMKSYPSYEVYVARFEGRIVGTIALLVMDNLAHLGAPSAIVEDVCVDAGCRGQGIGKEMMEFAMTTAAEKGCYKLTLSSNLSRTRAHDFYLGLGFRQHGLSFQVDLP
ncbi:MAG: GNAT family N-acetyltransferase [Planctomycetes bacterium]|nr:GNAT family N-acetyltransferase [Planctomycetota bacterium]